MFVTTHYMDEADRCTLLGYIYMSRLIAFGRPDELKVSPHVTPQGQQRYEVESAAPPVVLARARKNAAILDATLLGSLVHVLSDESLSPEDLLAQIAPDDAQASIRPVAASLEDVFVVLSRSHANNGGAPGRGAA
jgi:ABC-type multidrug transport system ATPase subunit